MRRAIFLAGVVALAGCGSDDGPAAPSAKPDTALAQRCGLTPTSYPSDPGRPVPDGLAPEGTRIALVEQQGDSTRAVLHIPLSVPATLQQISGAATSRGYKIDFSENENFEAELFMTSPEGERVEFRLKAAPKCRDAVRAVMARGSGA